MGKNPESVKKLNIKTAVVLSFILSAALACAQPVKTSSETEMQGDSSVKDEPAFKPVSKAECQGVQTKLEKALKAKFQLTADKASSFPKGSGCYLETKGNGLKFDMVKTSADIEKTIGWEKEDRYAAGGPVGMNGGLKKGKKVIVYGILLDEELDGGCSDKPVADCVSKPEKQMYTVSAWIGQQD